MKKLILLALVNSSACLAQQMNPQQIRGTAVVQSAPASQTITQPAGTTLSVSSLNNVLNANIYAGADIGAKVNAAVASSDCASGCTINIPPGTYTQTTAIIVNGANVRISGNGSVLNASGAYTAQLTIRGNNDVVSGISFVPISGIYGIIATAGINQRILGNNFSGVSVSYIAVSGSPSGALIQNNSFNGQNGCAFQNNVSIFWSSHVTVSNNNSTNTCGFAVQVSASKQTAVHDNTIYQDTQTRSIVATSGQTNFVFNWPSSAPPISRVWLEVNGVPTTASSTTYTNATTTTVVMPSQASGNIVTALAWSGLESIQANSQAFDTVIDGNVVTGTGDAGIDVVSDYHIIPNGTSTAGTNQTVFSIVATPGITTQALPFANGRVLTPDEASISNIGNTYTITLKTPAMPGTTVMLGDWTLNLAGTVASDFPQGVTIQNNVVKNIAGSCITPEVAASGIVIQGNVMENCGMGVATAAFSSGIFTGNAIGLTVKNNTIINSRAVPTMNAGISVQCSGCETGEMQKPVLLSGNTFTGPFSNGGIYIPVLLVRQSGIDISDGSTVVYPEQPNFDRPWTVSPPNTHYLSYSCSGGGMTRDTTNVIGGVASAQISSGNVCDISPTNQIFFYNSIMEVTFWAKQVSGTPKVEIFSTLAANSVAVPINVTGTAWKQYSIYLPTSELDNPPGLFFRVDGSSGVMNIQNIVFQVVPISTKSTPGAGASSGVTQNQYTDSLSVGNMTGSGSAMVCVDPTGNVFRGTATTCP